MTTLRRSADRPLPSLDRAPIDRLHGLQPNVLAEFVERRARPWGGAQVSLTSAVTAALWVLLLLALGLSGGMLAVQSDVMPCGGPLCSVVTLGDHPALTLALSTAGAGSLLATSAVTRGLTEASGPQFAVVVVGALIALVALVGVFALLLAAAFILAIVVIVADRL